MSEYEVCAGCNATLRMEGLPEGQRCEHCGSVLCRDCLAQGCLVCRTERNLLLLSPARPRKPLENGED
jgi:hypothetical protein